MKDIEKENMSDIPKVLFEWGMATLLSLLVYATVIPVIRENELYMVPQQDRQTVSQEYDVNGDGLVDIIRRDGTIGIRQRDGSYLSLKESFWREKRQLEDNYILERDSQGKYHTKGLVCLTEQKESNKIKKHSMKGGNE